MQDKGLFLHRAAPLQQQHETLPTRFGMDDL